MKQVSTLFLQGVIAVIALIALVFCVILLPGGIRAEDTLGYRPMLIGLYAAAVPFFYALYQALTLLGYIDKNQAFTARAVRALRNIKYAALVISALFMAGMPYIYHVADKDDAPGVVAIALIITGAAFVIGTFAALLQKLFQNAVDIKSENDLTV